MTNKHKACFVVPYYRSDKDDACLSDFIDTGYQCGQLDNVYFIVDNEDVKEYVKKLLNRYYFQYEGHIIIIPDSKKFYGPNRNIPTIKKFYGLKEIYKKFDYIATIDVDSIFLKSFDPYEVMDEIWKNKSSFFKNKCSFSTSIFLRNTAYLCGLENNKFLIKETDDFTYSCWFNDIPVYDCSTVEDFFNWIENTKTKNDKTIIENIKDNFCAFDYWVYWYYMICFKGMTSESINFYSFNSLMEDTCYDNNTLKSLSFVLNCDNKELNKEAMYDNFVHLIKFINFKEDLAKTHWTARDYKFSKDFCENDKLCIQFHVDRIKNFNRCSAYEVFWNKK